MLARPKIKITTSLVVEQSCGGTYTMDFQK